MGIMKKLFGEARRWPRVGDMVVVYTTKNWKADGTGGAPGQIMEVGTLEVSIMWQASNGEIIVTEFDRSTRRADKPNTIWFRLADEPYAADPALPMLSEDTSLKQEVSHETRINHLVDVEVKRPR